jgi:hypothetical protein
MEGGGGEAHGVFDPLPPKKSNIVHMCNENAKNGVMSLIVLFVSLFT